MYIVIINEGQGKGWRVIRNIKADDDLDGLPVFKTREAALEVMLECISSSGQGKYKLAKLIPLELKIEADKDQEAE